MSFRLEMASEVRDWLHQLRRTDRPTAILVGQAITALLDEGPALGRPLVDRINGSKLHNLKRTETGLRGSKRGENPLHLRPRTRLLVAGDKAGRWTTWYREAIPAAEARYAIYLKERQQP